MLYLAIPLALFMMSPLWIGGWGAAHLADKIQRSIEEPWDQGLENEAGGVRTSEGTVGPPRN